MKNLSDVLLSTVKTYGPTTLAVIAMGLVLELLNPASKVLMPSPTEDRFGFFLSLIIGASLFLLVCLMLARVDNGIDHFGSRLKFSWLGSISITVWMLLASVFAVLSTAFLWHGISAIDSPVISFILKFLPVPVLVIILGTLVSKVADRLKRLDVSSGEVIGYKINKGIQQDKRDSVLIVGTGNLLLSFMSVEDDKQRLNALKGRTDFVFEQWQTYKANPSHSLSDDLGQSCKEAFIDKDPLRGLILHIQEYSDCSNDDHPVHHPWMQLIRAIRLNYGKPDTNPTQRLVLATIVSDKHQDRSSRKTWPGPDRNPPIDADVDYDLERYEQFAKQLLSMHTQNELAKETLKFSDLNRAESGFVWVPRKPEDQSNRSNAASTDAEKFVNLNDYSSVFSTVRSVINRQGKQRSVTVDISSGIRTAAAASMAACIKERAYLSYVHTIHQDDRRKTAIEPSLTHCTVGATMEPKTSEPV